MLTEGMGLANTFSQANEQSVVFIKESGVSWQISHEEGLIGSVAVTVGCQAQAADDTAGIGVNNEGWPVSGVQYYGVGSFLANAIDSKELFAEAVNTAGK